MMTKRRTRWLRIGACALILVAVGATWVLSRSVDSSSNRKVNTSTPAHSSTPRSTTPLRAPSATVTDDARFLTDVTEVDPALTTYEKSSGNVALRSLLTDGSAFCAFLQRDRDLDTAMVSVVVGARQVESQTRLPVSVTTFNAIDSVALLTLCPSLQPVVPVSDLAKIRRLGTALAVPPN